MGTAVKEKTIEGRSVKVNQFPASYGWRVFCRLSRGVIPAIAAIAGSVKDWKTIDIQGDGLAKAAEYIVTEMEPEKSEALIKDLLSMTFIDGKEAVKDFDLTFQGEYLLLMKCLAFSIEVNYKSFLGKSGMGKLQKTLAAIQ